MVRIVTISTPSLGDRSYLVHDGQVAVVIDPQRDIDRILEIARSEDVQITHVFETHIHNDYITGGLALAQAVGAAYVIAAGEPVRFERTAAADGDRFVTGQLTITAYATPGHTPRHLAYGLAHQSDPVSAVFTGGSLLYGAVGRTDLISPDQTLELTHAQYHSVRRLADHLDDDVEVFPTHGFGSFCSASPTNGDNSTVGQQRHENIAFTFEDEDLFVETIMHGLGPYPRYYARMGPANLAGPAPADLATPAPIDGPALHRHLVAGHWVVDLRRRAAFAAHHLTGSISVELGPSFATQLGWIIPWDTPLILIGDNPDQVSQAQRELARIGINHLTGATTLEIDQLATRRVGNPTASAHPTATFADLAGVLTRPNLIVLDVRRPDEWDDEHLAAATHIPLWNLQNHLDDIPPGDIWVHCHSGYRASIAASLLQRAGRQVTLIDDSWGHAKQLGLSTSGSPSAPSRR